MNTMTETARQNTTADLRRARIAANGMRPADRAAYYARTIIGIMDAADTLDDVEPDYAAGVRAAIKANTTQIDRLGWDGYRNALAATAGL